MSDDESLPTGLELTALHEDFRRDPYPILDVLRAKDPVHDDKVLQRWFVTDHDVVREIVRRKDFVVNPETVDLPSPPEPEWLDEIVSESDRQPSILGLDDPDHKRLRGLVSKAFTPRSIEAFRPRIEQIVDDVLAPLKSLTQFDLIKDFAGPIPTIVIAEMLGVDASDQEQFKAWSNTVVSTFNPLLSEDESKHAMRTSETMRRYFHAEISKRRASPRDDLIAAMMRAQEAGDHLTDEEIVTMCDLLIVAGNVTTTDLIGNGVLALLRHPEQMQKLRDNPGLIENAVEEMLRYDSPVVMTGRFATDETEFMQRKIKRGDRFNPSLAGANHDPAVYDEPHRFDIERKDTHHHSFGGGIHHCLGAPLARLEAQIAITRLLAAFPTLVLAEAEVKRRNLPVFQGCERLILRTT